jgi:ABC-type transport system involved in multi-copper enzyme maturation permease subunit
MASILSQVVRLYAEFLDPVFLKDLEGLSRRWRLYAGRMFYITLVGLIVYLFLRDTRSMLSPSASAELGRHLFNGLVTFQMMYVTIVMAHLAADMLLREARSGTLQLMLLTPLSGWRIALGKWKAVMAHAVMLILAGLPPLAITAYLGGVGLWELLWSPAVSLALAGLSSSMALYAALRARTAVRAAMAALLHIGLTGILLLFVSGILFAITRSSWVMFAAGMLHPIVAVVGATNVAWFGAPAGYGWIGATVFFLVIAQVYLMSAAGHLSISSTLDELLAPPGTATEKPGRASIGLRRVWDRHPLLWRECAINGVSGQDWTRRLALVLLCSVLVFVLMPVVFHPSVLNFWLVALSGLAMAAGAGLFIGDKQGRHLEVLLTLPVTNEEVVGAKLLSRIWSVEGVVFVLSILVFLKVWFGDRTLLAVSMAPLILSFVLFAYVLAALASLHVQTSRSAYVLAAAVVWGALFGLSALKKAVPIQLLALIHPTVLGGVFLEANESDPLLIAGFVGVYALMILFMIVTMVRRFRLQVT